MCHTRKTLKCHLTGILLACALLCQAWILLELNTSSQHPEFPTNDDRNKEDDTAPDKKAVPLPNTSGVPHIQKFTTSASTGRVHKLQSDACAHAGLPGSDVIRREAENISLVKPLNDVTRIIYNRVPKCGSTSVRQNFMTLAKINHYHWRALKVYRRFNISELEQKEKTDQILSYPTPLVYDGHLHYINFTRFGHEPDEQPAYINVVRDPLERMVSSYYFFRFDRQTDMDNTTKYRSFDDCVKLGIPECVGDSAVFQIVPFFCGQEDFCRIASQRALQQAKYNVVQYYAVVGVTDDLAAFFRVLQHRFPRFFRGSERTYWQNEKNMHGMSKSSQKKPIRYNTRTLMQPLLKYDYDFYYFIKQRFYQQLQQLSIIWYH